MLLINIENTNYNYSLALLKTQKNLFQHVTVLY
jgi:hypothetical protein